MQPNPLNKEPLRKSRMPTPTIPKIAQQSSIAIKSVTPNLQLLQQPVTPKVGIPRILTSNLQRSSKQQLPTFFETRGFGKLSLPNITRQKSKDNIWLPVKVTGNHDIKITTMTPLGTIPMVPTAKGRLTKISRSPKNITLNILSPEGIDPILTATVYLDCTKQEDQPYTYISNRMRSIAQATKSSKQYFVTQFKPLADIAGKVNIKIFEDMLSIYENNQVFYQDKIEDYTMDMTSIVQGLTQLEYWFMFIIEPKPTYYDEIIAWKDRELFKINKGISCYCDPDLYSYIEPMPNIIREKLLQLQI